MRNLTPVSLCTALAIAIAGPAAAQAVTFTPDHVNGIYAVGETVGWTLHGPLGMAERFSYVIRENDLTVLKQGEIDLSSGKTRLEVKLDHPGMIYARLTPEGAPAPATPPTPFDLDKLTVGAAVAPTQIAPSLPRPADFDAFWAGKLAAQAKVPINPVLAPAASGSPDVSLSTVTLDSLGSHVHGYLAQPTKPGKYPALVIYQYAGVYKLTPQTVLPRAAEGWIALDVDSHDMAPDQATAPQDYQHVGDDSRETSYFLDMYLRDSRALDYIQSLPNWDGHILVVMGTSMGGQQSLVTAGLNPQRVTAVLVDVPAGADIDGEAHGRKVGYPNWPQGDAQAMAAGPYFDTVNFASAIRAPALVAMGFIDTTCPPVGIWAAFNQIPGAKEAVPMVWSDHNHITPQAQEVFYRRSKEILDTLRTGGGYQPDPNWAQDNHP